MATVLLVVGGSAWARRASSPTPDFTGLWSNASLTELERPDDFKTLTVTEAQAQAFEKAHRGKPPVSRDEKDNPVGGAESEWWERDVGLARIRGQARTSWLVSPADGQLPLSPTAKAASKARRERFKTDFDGPESRPSSERCIAPGAAPPLDNGGYNDNFQFVQAGGSLAIHAEWMHDVRVIRLAASPTAPEARHPPPSIRTDQGDSVGHWEGQTLVIETTNFTPGEVRPANGDPNADMKVIERISRLSPTELLYTFSVTNPARYTQTWQAEMLLHATKGPIFEFACHEGNYGLPNILAGARRLESRTIDGVTAGH